MMTMIRWNPLAELEELRRKMDNLFEQSAQLVHQQELPSQGWQPAAEIFENDHELVVEIDLPGILQEAIQVRIEDHTLMVSGERKPLIDAEFSTQRCERSYGPFYREFSLPGDIDENLTQASCDHGVLQVRLRKKSPGVPKRIDVEIR
jgi:HSP20 family protein